MAHPRTALRSLGVLAAVSGLSLAGAGIASATTSEHEVESTTVSVTFTLEEDQTTDTCGAALIPATAAPEILKGLKSEAPSEIFTTLAGIDGVTLLKAGGSYTVTLAEAAPSATLTATDVNNGAYLLASLCFSELDNPGTELVTIGSPLDIIGGLSSGNLLETGSALLQGEDGLGQLDLGTLSSAVGGEQD